jgi:hypothetical protein
VSCEGGFQFTNSSIGAKEEAVMAEPSRISPSAVTKAGSESADDIDLVIKRIVAFLDSTSRSPIEDADRISSFVNEYRSLCVRAKRSASTPSEELPEMFKDEPIPESSAVSRAGTTGQQSYTNLKNGCQRRVCSSAGEGPVILSAPTRNPRSSISCTPSNRASSDEGRGM